MSRGLAVCLFPGSGNNRWVWNPLPCVLSKSESQSFVVVTVTITVTVTLLPCEYLSLSFQ